MDKTIKYDASSDDNFESRIQIKIERDSTKDLTVEGRQVGKITKYNYLILQRDKAPIKGYLTRDEVGFYWICYHPTILCYPIGLKLR